MPRLHAFPLAAGAFLALIGISSSSRAAENCPYGNMNPSCPNNGLAERAAEQRAQAEARERAQDEARQREQQAQERAQRDAEQRAELEARQRAQREAEERARIEPQQHPTQDHPYTTPTPQPYPAYRQTPTAAERTYSPGGSPSSARPESSAGKTYTPGRSAGTDSAASPDISAAHVYTPHVYTPGRTESDTAARTSSGVTVYTPHSGEAKSRPLASSDGVTDSNGVKVFTPHAHALLARAETLPNAQVAHHPVPMPGASPHAPPTPTVPVRPSKPAITGLPPVNPRPNGIVPPAPSPTGQGPALIAGASGVQYKSAPVMAAPALYAPDTAGEVYQAVHYSGNTLPDAQCGSYTPDPVQIQFPPIEFISNGGAPMDVAVSMINTSGCRVLVRGLVTITGSQGDVYTSNNNNFGTPTSGFDFRNVYTPFGYMLPPNVQEFPVTVRISNIQVCSATAPATFPEPTYFRPFLDGQCASFSDQVINNPNFYQQAVDQGTDCAAGGNIACLLGIGSATNSAGPQPVPQPLLAPNRANSPQKAAMAPPPDSCDHVLYPAC